MKKNTLKSLRQLDKSQRGQVLIFAAFGLNAPVAMTFSLLRRGRELLWVGFGLIVLLQGQALRWIREARDR